MYRRGLDILVGSALAVLTLPILVVAAVGAAISLRAWPFFCQVRVGQDGTPFHFLKVRTLRVDVPEYIDKHQLDAAHIPAFCQLLRRLHLDELPQLLLVLRGKMSLVGPRPEMAHLHAKMPDGFATSRTSVRPGCTGLWQVSESSTELIGAAPHYDHFYLAARSLRLDLWVLYRTALTMAGVGRAISLDDVPTWAQRPGARAALDALIEHDGTAATLRIPATAAR